MVVMDPDTAKMQEQALQDAAQDAPLSMATADLAQDVPKATLPGNEEMGKDVYGNQWDKPWDQQWVRQLRGRLLKAGLITEEDLKETALMDPQHRRWLNKQLKKLGKAKQEGATTEPESETGEATPEETIVETAQVGPRETQMPSAFPPAMSNNNVAPRVIPTGRLPSGQLFQTTAGPWGSGWIPAGNGLYWPPWPTAGGPVAMPGPRRRQGEAEPMPRTLTAEGQVEMVERA